jgi:hypothetical protein
VHAEPPGGGVALRSEEVAPVLHEEPQTDRRKRERGRVAKVHETGPDGDEIPRGEGQAEMPFVNPNPEDEDPRTQTMAFQAG